MDIPPLTVGEPVTPVPTGGEITSQVVGRRDHALTARP